MGSHTFPVQDRRPFRLVDSRLWSRCLWGKELGWWCGILSGYFLGNWQFSICAILGNLVWHITRFQGWQVESRCWGYSPCQLVDGEPSATWGAWEPRPSLPFPLRWLACLLLHIIALSQLGFSLWFYILWDLCSGGGSVVGGEQDLWAIGGGDGQVASGVTQVCKFYRSQSFILLLKNW